MTGPLIQIRNVSKSYRRDSMSIPVLQRISLDVPEGEFIALMGPSGSGKTTLLNLIAGIDRPNDGSITVDGTEVTRLGESELAKWRARHIGFVFQFYNLIPVLTAYENVELPLLLTPLSKAERKQHVTRSAWWGSRTGYITTRGSCPAGRSSASRSRARSLPIPRSSWPTSPLVTSIVSRPRRS